MNLFISKAISSVRVGTFLVHGSIICSWNSTRHLAKHLSTTRSKSKLRTACATENALSYITLI